MFSLEHLSLSSALSTSFYFPNKRVLLSYMSPPFSLVFGPYPIMLWAYFWLWTQSFSLAMPEDHIQITGSESELELNPTTLCTISQSPKTLCILFDIDLGVTPCSPEVWLSSGSALRDHLAVLGNHYGVLGIEHKFSMCKANTRLTILSLQFLLKSFSVRQGDEPKKAGQDLGRTYVFWKQQFLSSARVPEFFWEIG